MKIKNTLLTIAILAILAGILTYIYYSFFASLNIVPVAENSEPVNVASVAGDYNSGNIDQAISKGETLVAGDSQNVPALLALASSYLMKGSISFSEENYAQKAIELGNKAIVLDPNSSEAYWVIAYAYEIMQKYDQAISNYDKAISLDAKNSAAVSGKGHVYDLQGKLKEAEVLYDKALAIDPKNDHASLNKARSLFRSGELASSRSVLDQLLKSSSNKRFLAEGNLLMALILIGQEDADYLEAEKAVLRSMLYDRSVPQAYVTLGLIKLNTLSLASSQEDFDQRVAQIYEAIGKALDINPNQAGAYYLASIIASMRGDAAKQTALEKRALEAIPWDITLGAEEKKALAEVIKTGAKTITLK